MPEAGPKLRGDSRPKPRGRNIEVSRDESERVVGSVLNPEVAADISCGATIRITHYDVPIASLYRERATGVIACTSCPVTGVIRGAGKTPEEAHEDTLDAARSVVGETCVNWRLKAELEGLEPGTPMPDDFLPAEFKQKVPAWTPERAEEIEGLLSELVTSGVGLPGESALDRFGNAEHSSYLVRVAKDRASLNGYYLRYKPLSEMLEAWSDNPGGNLPLGLERRISGKFPNATHEVARRLTGFGGPRYQQDFHIWAVSELDLRAASNPQATSGH